MIEKYKCIRSFVSIGSIALIRSVMYLRYFENPGTFVTTAEQRHGTDLTASRRLTIPLSPCDASPLRTNEAALSGHLTFSVVLHTDRIQLCNVFITMQAEQF